MIETWKFRSEDGAPWFRPFTMQAVLRRARMKVLFYLPVVTSWWFEQIVEPILRRVASVADVHVLAPVPWQNTGIGPNDIFRCVDLDKVQWHIVNDHDHPSLRTGVADREGLLAFVRHLAPDVVLCRAADFATVSYFPGTVRFLMEVAAMPFDVVPWTTMITAQPFANGVMPDLGAAERDRLEALFDPLWSTMQAYWHQALPDREAMMREVGIPGHRPMLLLPLDYEHEENFFLQHRVPQRNNCALLTAIAEDVTPRCTLIVTDHPLNKVCVDRTALHETIARLGQDVVFVDSDVLPFPATLTLARHADGMLLGDSKSFGLAACFGVPMLRRSCFATGDWLHAETDLGRFIAAVEQGSARRPAEADARCWFAYHLANEALNPKATDLTGDDLLDRIFRPVNPERWEAAIARVNAVKPEYLH